MKKDIHKVNVKVDRMNTDVIRMQSNYYGNYSKRPNLKKKNKFSELIMIKRIMIR